MFRGQVSLLEMLKASEQEVYDDLSKIFENIELDMKGVEDIVEELPKKREAPSQVIQDDRQSIDGLVKLMQENKGEGSCSKIEMQRLINMNNRSELANFMLRHQKFEGVALASLKSLGEIQVGSNSDTHLRVARFIQCYSSNSFSAI